MRSNQTRSAAGPKPRSTQAYGYIGLGDFEAATRTHEHIDGESCPDPVSLFRLGRLAAIGMVHAHGWPVRTPSEPRPKVASPAATTRADRAQLALLSYSESAADGVADEHTLVTRLRAEQPGLLENLSEGHSEADRGLSLGAYLARFWPY